MSIFILLSFIIQQMPDAGETVI